MESRYSEMHSFNKRALEWKGLWSTRSCSGRRVGGSGFNPGCLKTWVRFDISTAVKPSILTYAAGDGGLGKSLHSVPCFYTSGFPSLSDPCRSIFLRTFHHLLHALSWPLSSNFSTSFDLAWRPVLMHCSSSQNIYLCPVLCCSYWMPHSSFMSWHFPYVHYLKLLIPSADTVGDVACAKHCASYRDVAVKGWCFFLS